MVMKRFEIRLDLDVCLDVLGTDVQSLLEAALSYMVFMKGGHGMWTEDDIEMVKRELHVRSEEIMNLK